MKPKIWNIRLEKNVTKFGVKVKVIEYPIRKHFQMSLIINSLDAIMWVIRWQLQIYKMVLCVLHVWLCLGLLAATS